MTTTPVDVFGADNSHSRFPEGEIAVVLGEIDHTNSRRRINTLSLGYSRTFGRDEQQLAATTYIDVNGTSIAGPVTVQNEASLGLAHLRFTRHLYINEHFSWSWAAGVSYADFDYVGSSATQHISLEQREFGLHGQMGVAYHLTPQWGLEGIWGGHLFPASNDSSLVTGQLSLAFTPNDAVRLFAGYRDSDYHLYNWDGPSDINYQFAGPTAGLTLTF